MATNLKENSKNATLFIIQAIFWAIFYLFNPLFLLNWVMGLASFLGIYLIN